MPDEARRDVKISMIDNFSIGPFCGLYLPAPGLLHLGVRDFLVKA